jgi:hypothetical protein
MIEKMIIEACSLIEEPICFTLKYDGVNFKLDIPLGPEGCSVVSCNSREYFNLEESIATALLHYMKAKTENKESPCQDELKKTTKISST